MEESFIYFIDNQDYLSATYPGRYLLIKDNSILGDFDSESEAAHYAENQLKIMDWTFLIQKCAY
jgi:hypothetical protein